MTHLLSGPGCAYSLLWILKAILSFVLWHGCCMGGCWQSLFFIDIFLNENFQNLLLILTDLKVHIDRAMITLYTLLVPFSFISHLHSFTQSPLLDASTKGVCPSAQGCLLLALRPYLFKLLVDWDLFLLMSYIFSFLSHFIWVCWVYLSNLFCLFHLIWCVYVCTCVCV